MKNVFAREHFLGPVPVSTVLGIGIGLGTIGMSISTIFGLPYALLSACLTLLCFLVYDGAGRHWTMSFAHFGFSFWALSIIGPFFASSSLPWLFWVLIAVWLCRIVLNIHYRLGVGKIHGTGQLALKEILEQHGHDDLPHSFYEKFFARDTETCILAPHTVNSTQSLLELQRIPYTRDDWRILWRPRQMFPRLTRVEYTLNH